jgi:phosphonate transport system substrate-binding protein
MMKHVLLYILFTIIITACSDTKNEKIYHPSGEVITKKIYVVGIHPYLNSKKTYDSYRPILDYLEEHIQGSSFILETSSTYANYNEKLYRGDFDFSLPNPFQTFNSLEHDYEVIAKMKPDSVFRGIFVARKEMKLKDVQLLKNHSVSFPAPTALAATMMPLYYLYEQGLDLSTITKKYVGSQYSSILNAYSSDTIAGATWPPPWEAWCKENPDKAKEMEVVWQTHALVNNGFVVRKDVEKELAKEVADVLSSLDKTIKGQKILHNAGFEGFDYATNDNYLIVKDFIEKYDKAIGLPK